MDSRQFDALTRALSVPGSRRTLSTLLGSGLGWLTLAGFGSPDAVAKKKNKKRKKRKKRKKNKGPCGDVCASGCPFSSIQEAIAAASAGDTIRLCAEIYGELISIEKDLTLIGADDGLNGTALDGQGNGPVVTVASGVTVDLEGVRITGGDAESSGGGINNSGALTLTGCTVTGNEARFGGGGIQNNSALTLTDCTVTNNEAGNNGGGIQNSGGAVTLNDSNVTDNEAGNNGGGIFNAGTVTLNGASSVTDNVPDDCVNASGGTGCP